MSYVRALKVHRELGRCCTRLHELNPRTTKGMCCSAFSLHLICSEPSPTSATYLEDDRCRCNMADFTGHCSRWTASTFPTPGVPQYDCGTRLPVTCLTAYFLNF